MNHARWLQTFVAASFFAQNRFPLSRTMLYGKAARKDQG
jgi:hypothetical protein